MTTRRTTRPKRSEDSPPPGESPAPGRRIGQRGPSADAQTVGISARTRRGIAHTREEAEQLYVAARDAWTAAMKAAASGRPSDLAALAITQDAYEMAAAEWERWEAGERVAIPIQPESSSSVGAVVGQELAWRKVRQHDPKPAGLLGRIGRRLRGG